MIIIISVCTGQDNWSNRIFGHHRKHRGVNSYRSYCRSLSLDASQNHVDRGHDSRMYLLVDSLSHDP